MILVYDRNGRFQRYIGKRDDGEGGYFDRPSGIAIDPKSGRIFLLDTTRHMLIVLDSDGNVVRRLGRPDLDVIALRTRDGGESAKGKLQFPTDIVIRGGEAFVLGGSKITILDLDGRVQKEIAVMGGSYAGSDGLAVDSAGNLFVSDPAAGSIHAFDRNGTFLYSFGKPGSKHGEFYFPRGLWIDEHNQIYVADSKNGRVQVFQLHPQTSRNALTNCSCWLPDSSNPANKLSAQLGY